MRWTLDYRMPTWFLFFSSASRSCCGFHSSRGNEWLPDFSHWNHFRITSQRCCLWCCCLRLLRAVKLSELQRMVCSFYVFICSVQAFGLSNVPLQLRVGFWYLKCLTRWNLQLFFPLGLCAAFIFHNSQASWNKRYYLAFCFSWSPHRLTPSIASFGDTISMFVVPGTSVIIKIWLVLYGARVSLLTWKKHKVRNEITHQFWNHLARLLLKWSEHLTFFGRGPGDKKACQFRGFWSESVYHLVTILIPLVGIYLLTWWSITDVVTPFVLYKFLYAWNKRLF